MEIYPNETRSAKAEIASPEQRETERAIKSGKQMRYSPFLLPSRSLLVQSQSHAAPHLVVNATIRAVNNVTVSIPHRDLLQNEPVPNQQQQLLHRMKRQGERGTNLSICFYNSISIDVKRNDRFIKTVKIELEIVSRSRDSPFHPNPDLP